MLNLQFSFFPSLGAESISGREFVFTFAQNHQNAEDVSVLLVNQSPGLATVVVEVPDLTTLFAILTAYAAKTVNLPSDVVPAESHFDGRGGYAVIVKSSADISVFGMNDAHPRSMDGFAVLPTSALGTEYFVASFKPWTQSQISFVAVEDDTEVTITLATDWEHTGVSLKQGENLRFTVNQYETIHLDGKQDPTGSRILSNKPIALLTGCRCAFVPDDSIESCDHLVEQLLPFNRWGKIYLATVMMGRVASTIYRVIAGRSDTEISLPGQNRTVVLSARSFEEFEIWEEDETFIYCSVACLVVAFAQGYEADGLSGDPTFTIIPPLEQGVHAAHFVTYDVTKEVSAVQSYLTVIAECFTLDNATLDDEPLVNYQGLSYRRVETSRYCAARLTVPYGAHSLSAHEHYAPFVAFLYGFAPFNAYSFPVAMATDELTCSTDISGAGVVEHFCDESLVVVPSAVSDGGGAGDTTCDYSNCVYPGKGQAQAIPK